MSQYKHFSTKEREFILSGISKGLSLCMIAKGIGRNKSTVSRELRRNKVAEYYSPCEAQNYYLERRRNCCPKKKLLNQEIFNLVKDKFLNQQWSPQQISERLRLEKIEYFVSFNTIYRGIYSGMLDSRKLSHGEKGAKRHLRHKGKPRHRKGNEEKRGKIQITNNIAVGLVQLHIHQYFLQKTHLLSKMAVCLSKQVVLWQKYGFLYQTVSFPKKFLPQIYHTDCVLYAGLTIC